jgi:hypothetical protein
VVNDKFKKMKKIAIFCGLLFIVSCNDTTVNWKQKHIQKILYGKKSTLWGVYDKKLESKEVSYTFHSNGECDYLDENIEFSFKLGMVYPEDENWNIEIVNDSTIYLRCNLSVYRVLQYNKTYFKLFTSEFDTIYLYRSDCQSAECRIPDKMPAPNW